MEDLLHLDMDSFFASVEIAERPHLKDRPVVVAGDRTSRSVVATASYAARKYGIHSAMPLRTALSKCRDLVVIKADFEKYERCSGAVRRIIGEFTPETEQASIDEFYLRVGSSRMLFGTAVKIAQKIKKRINEELGLTCSIGISYNRLLAKMASGMKKPDGLTVISRQNLHQMIDFLDVGKLPGAGPRTVRILEEMGIRKIGELQNADRADLKRRFGVNALYLVNAARGIGPSDLVYDSDAGCVSHEITLPADTRDREKIRNVLLDLADRVAGRLRASGLSGKVVRVKIRHFDFRTFTRQVTLGRPVNTAGEIFRISLDLVSDLAERPVRLVGIGMSSLLDKSKGEQILMFGPQKADSAKLRCEEGKEAVERKFGKGSIKRASLLSRPEDQAR